MKLNLQNVGKLLLLTVASTNFLSAQILFSETFNSSLGGMTINNSSNGAWVWTNSCTRNSMTGHSQTGSAYFLGNGSTCQFGSGGSVVSGNMETPSISIPSLGGVLTFNYSLANECGTSGSTCFYDALKMQISNNGGTSFTDIYSSTGSPVGFVNGTGWAAKSYTLSAYAGQNIIIRFNFNSIDGVGNTYDGVYIDDIVVEGFVPCAGTPTVASIAATSTLICPMWGIVGLNSNSQYGMMGGIQYTWYSSTVSAVGPFSVVPNASLSAINTTSLPATTWYHAVITCTNSTFSNTTAAIQVSVEPTTYNTVPYYEGFESIQGPNRLPNCSWYAPNLSTSLKTYTASNTNNRVPRTGNNFMAYEQPSQNNYVYTNGIWMDPGITYSAALHYATEYVGYDNWKELSILIGNSQTPTGLVPVATASPATSGPYKLLSGLFTVPTSGYYYMAMKATAQSGNALYLNVDDISVTIPCTPQSMNQPTVTLSLGGNTTVCTGDVLSFNAVGADTYLWSTGATSANISPVALQTTTYTVTGTNTLTGCTDVKSQVVNVIPSPTVFIVSTKDSYCPGEIVYLTAYGADNYLWNNGPSSPVYSFTAGTTTGYSVSGTNLNGCSSSASKNITVLPLPNVSGTSSDPEMCVNESVMLQGSGAISYQWLSSSNSALLSGPTVIVSPNVSSTYTVIGTDANGCKNMSTVNQIVEQCVGITKHSALVDGLKVFPNPASAVLNIEYSSAISHVELVDLTGRVVRNESPDASKVEINISALANGVYYAKITVGGATEVVKVIKR